VKSALECRVGPLRRGDAGSLDRFESFFTQPDLQWVELSAAVVELAIRLLPAAWPRSGDANPPDQLNFKSR